MCVALEITSAGLPARRNQTPSHRNPTTCRLNAGHGAFSHTRTSHAGDVADAFPPTPLLSCGARPSGGRTLAKDLERRQSGEGEDMSALI